VAKVNMGEVTPEESALAKRKQSTLEEEKVRLRMKGLNFLRSSNT
jgi:hypothetical protein